MIDSLPHIMAMRAYTNDYSIPLSAHVQLDEWDPDGPLVVTVSTRARHAGGPWQSWEFVGDSTEWWARVDAAVEASEGSATLLRVVPQPKDTDRLPVKDEVSIELNGEQV